MLAYRKDFRSRVQEWLLWVIVTGIGWPAGVFLAALIVGYAPFFMPTAIELVLDILIGGVIIALGQFFVLRPETMGLRGWLGYSLAGWAAGVGVLLALGLIVRSTWGVLAGAALGGGLYGWLQGRALETGFASAPIWRFNSAASWLVAYSLGPVFQVEAAGKSIGDGLLGILENGLLGWTALSIIAALVLIIVVPRVRSGDLEDESEPNPERPE